MNALHLFALLAGYSLACLGMGLLVLRALATRFGRIETLSAATTLATAFLLGQGFLANLWLLLALPGWFAPPVVATIVGGLAILALGNAKTHLEKLLAELGAIWRDLLAERWVWKLVAGLTVALGLSLVTSIGRPMSKDGAKFYFALPKLIAHTNQLFPLPGVYEDFTGIGLQGEMHIAALMSLGSPDAARLFDLPTVIATCVMLLSLGRLIGLGRRGQWIALTMVLTSSAVYGLSTFAKTDLYAAAFGVAAIYWALHLDSVDRSRGLLLGGCLAGLSVIGKLSYLATLLPGIAILLAWRYLPAVLRAPGALRNTPGLLRFPALFSAGFALAVIPHVVKNGVLFGNPLAPLLTNNPGWLVQPWYGPETTRHILFTYPLALTFGNYYAQLGNLTPLVLAYLPLLTLAQPRSLLNQPAFRMVLLAVVSGLLVWIAARPSLLAPRYYLANLLVLCLLTARVAEGCLQIERAPKVVSNAIAGATIVAMSVTWVSSIGTVFFPTQSLDLYTGRLGTCARDGRACEAMTSLNEIAPAGARVFTNSYQRYWLRPDLIQCLLSADEIRAYHSLSRDEDRWAFIFDHGFRYLVVFDNSGRFLEQITLPDYTNKPHWLSVKQEFLGGTQVLVLDSRQGARETGSVCRELEANRWSVVSASFQP